MQIGDRVYVEFLHSTILRVVAMDQYGYTVGNECGNCFDVSKYGIEQCEGPWDHTPRSVSLIVEQRPVSRMYAGVAGPVVQPADLRNGNIRKFSNVPAWITDADVLEVASKVILLAIPESALEGGVNFSIVARRASSNTANGMPILRIKNVCGMQVAASAPDENWIPTNHEELNAMLRSPLTPLHIEAGIQYYGYLYRFPRTRGDRPIPPITQTHPDYEEGN